MITKERYKEINQRHRQMKGIKTKDIFTVKVNNDAERFEFTPILNGFTSYTVSFLVATNLEEAWVCVDKSLKLQGEL